MGSLIEKLQSLKPDTVTQILREMVSPTDIELKTDLPNSMTVSRIRLASELYKEEGAPETGKLIKSFLDFYVRDRISDHSVKRAEQVINAVGALMQRQDSIGDKMLGEQGR